MQVHFSSTSLISPLNSCLLISRTIIVTFFSSPFGMQAGILQESVQFPQNLSKISSFRTRLPIFAFGIEQKKRLPLQPAMKKNIRKVAEFLKKAVVAIRGKASVLRARLLFLASLRRRTAMVGAISHRMRALMAGGGEEEKAAATDGRGKPALAAAEDGEVEEQLVALAGLRHDDVGLSELATLFQEVDDDGGGYPDWTHSLFDVDDDGDEDGVISTAGDADDERRDGDQAGEDEPSVIDVIRKRREGDGEEFNIEEEIDYAADMFIRRVRHRMTNRRSF